MFIRLPSTALTWLSRQMPSLVSYSSRSATCATGAQGSGSGRYAWGHQHCVVIAIGRAFKHSSVSTAAYQFAAIARDTDRPRSTAILLLEQNCLLTQALCSPTAHALYPITIHLWFIPLQSVPRRRAMLNVAAEGWSLTCSLVQSLLNAKWYRTRVLFMYEILCIVYSCISCYYSRVCIFVYK